MKRISVYVVSCSLTLALLLHHDSWANAASEAALAENAAGGPAAPPKEQPNGALDEIIVTARKRPESILKVPVDEVAVPQAKLESLQVTDIADLPKLVPGLDIGENVLTIGTLVAIRGVGTTSYDQGVDPSVGLNIDGISMGSGLMFQSGLFDLGGVEVLKGPQSLFYGKSTTAGVIALRSADPTDQVEVIGRAGYETQAKTWRGEAIFSGPVADGLKLRLATLYSTSDGFFYNDAVPAEQYGAQAPEYDRGPHVSEDYKVRLTALWDPTEQLTARFKANVDRLDTNDGDTPEIFGCYSGVNGAPPINIPFIGPYNDCRIGRNYYNVAMNPTFFPGITNGGYPFLDTKMGYGSLDLNYRPVRDFSISSTTGYYSITANALENALETTYAAPAIAAGNVYHRHAWSEELRGNSDFSGPFNFTAGVYAENGLVSNDITYYGNGAFGFPAIPNDTMDSIRIKSISGFAQGRYQVISPLELAAGARYAEETRTQDPINELTGLPVAGQVPEIHSAKTMPEATITYTPTDDMTVYGAYKKGFKSGSFSIATPVVPFLDNSFGDETAQGGEVGLKSRWLERRLIFNATWYLYDYSGLQVGATQPPENGVLVTRTVNAGAARTWGIDSDAAYRPEAINGLQVNAAVEWNHARYTELNNVPCWASQTIAQGCNQDYNPATGLYNAQNLSGTQMERAPAWQINVGASYDLVLPNAYKLTFTQANAYFSSSPTTLAVGRPGNDQLQRAYTKIDLGVELNSPDEVWSVAIIGKNIGDSIVTGTCSYQAYQTGVVFPGTTTGGTSPGPGGLSSPVCFVEAGREIWLRFTVRPFGVHH